MLLLKNLSIGVPPSFEKLETNYNEKRRAVIGREWAETRVGAPWMGCFESLTAFSMAEKMVLEKCRDLIN
jgi:hypothetical protein